jgi:hypothetical protein
MKLQATVRQQQDYLRLPETLGVQQSTEHKNLRHVWMMVLVSNLAAEFYAFLRNFFCTNFCVISFFRHIKQRSYKLTVDSIISGVDSYSYM